MDVSRAVGLWSRRVRVEPSGCGVAIVRRGSTAAPLQSGRGSTVIANVVVTKIAGIAAREVGGVHTLAGGTPRPIGAMTQTCGVGDERTQGVNVEFDHKVDVHIEASVREA